MRMPACVLRVILSDRDRRVHRPFTLQYVAGHDNIKTTMRYVHPREPADHKLLVRPVLRPEGRIACCKIRAEVVELADTPS
jgi:hypothetical protein